MDLGAAGFLAFFQKIKGENPVFLYLFSRSNKRLGKVDSDNLRNFAGEFEGASTDCATKVKSSKGFIFCMRKEEFGTS